MSEARWILLRPRSVAILLAGASGTAMFYVGLYQTRGVHRLWCPVFGKGCEAVADAPFARPFGVPDGYLGAAMYGAILLLLMGPAERKWEHITLLVLAGMATLANVLGVRDMMQLGQYCFYCVVTSIASPFLLWAVWKIKR